MLKDKLDREYTLIASSEGEAFLYDMKDSIYALVFCGKDGKISAAAAKGAADMLKQNEAQCNGVVIFGKDGNLCRGNAQELTGDPAVPQAFQELTSAIKHFSKPVVTLMTGESFGYGYEIALNSHAVLVSPDVSRFGYDLSAGPPMGGGLTAQIIDTYAVGNNVWGHDIVPFLKALLNNVYAPKKTADIFEAKARGLLPKTAVIVGENQDMVEKGKQKALNMYSEGFEKAEEASAEVSGTTGRAAMEITIVNGYEGGFMPPQIYPVALKIANVISGGNVPKKTLVSEKQFLNLEAQAFIAIAREKKEGETA